MTHKEQLKTQALSTHGLRLVQKREREKIIKEEGSNCFTSTSCLSSSLLPSFIIYHLSSTPDEDHVSKALAFLIVLYVSSYR